MRRTVLLPEMHLRGDDVADQEPEVLLCCLNVAVCLLVRCMQMVGISRLVPAEQWLNIFCLHAHAACGASGASLLIMPAAAEYASSSTQARGRASLHDDCKRRIVQNNTCASEGDACMQTLQPNAPK